MAAFALRPDSAGAKPALFLADSNQDTVRSAPRVPAGRHSLAAAFAFLRGEIAA